MASHPASPPVSLKERIAALQQRNGATSPTPAGQGSAGGRASPGAGATSTTATGPAPGSLRDRISKFEQKGGTPVPRGSFGMGAPAPQATDAGVRRRGELYGNRLGLAHHSDLPPAGRATSLHPSRRGSEGEGADRPGAGRRAASDYVSGSRPLSPGLDDDYPGGSAYDSRAPSPGPGGSRAASPALHDAQAKLEALQSTAENADGELAPGAVVEEAPSSPPSDAQVALAGVLSGTGSPPPSEPTETIQSTVEPTAEAIVSSPSLSTPSDSASSPVPDADRQAEDAKTEATASPAPGPEGTPAPWIQNEDLRSDAPPRPSVDTVRPSRQEPLTIIPPSISISTATAPNTAVPSSAVLDTPHTTSTVDSKEDTPDGTTSPITIPEAAGLNVEKDINVNRMSVDTAEILTGSPVTFSPVTTKPMYFTASQVPTPKNQTPPSSAASPTSPSDTEPTSPGSFSMSPPPTGVPGSRSFSAVVHRRTTLRKAQTERPATMYDNAEYVDQGLADRPRVPVQKASDADLSDLGALLANAALLEQKLESGPIASPKREAFGAAAIPSISQTMSRKKSAADVAPARGEASHGRNDSQMTLRPTRPDTPPAPAPSFGEFGEFDADLALPAADAIGKASMESAMGPPPPPPKDVDGTPRGKAAARPLKSSASALRRLSTALMPERYSMSSSDDSASVATPPNSDFDGHLVTPPRNTRAGRDDAASIVSGRSVNSRWSFKGSTKSLSRASTVASKFFSRGRRPSVSEADPSIGEEKPPRLPSPSPTMKPLDLPHALDTQSLTPTAHGQFASRRDTWMSTASSAISSPGIDGRMIDEFPTVPSGHPPGALKLDMAELRYGNDGTLLTPPERSSSLHQRAFTLPTRR